MGRELVVRLWLPDRPGALGQVASRIGAVHGDVTAIDILERGAGRVIDEVVITLPDTTSIELLAKEIGAVDGVAVEHILPAAAGRPDPATAYLQLAAEIAAATPDDRAATLGRGLLVAADADWVVIARAATVLLSLGDPPDPRWLEAFLDGSGHLGPSVLDHRPGELMWARLPGAELSVAVGRAGRPIHQRERHRLDLLAMIAGQLVQS
jgi:hypothetical protein